MDPNSLDFASVAFTAALLIGGQVLARALTAWGNSRRPPAPAAPVAPLPSPLPAPAPVAPPSMPRLPQNARERLRLLLERLQHRVEQDDIAREHEENQAALIEQAYQALASDKREQIPF